jgi:hypothetical protein
MELYEKEKAPEPVPRDDESSLGENSSIKSSSSKISKSDDFLANWTSA